MGKQILIVPGGGRPKGNTAQLVEAFTRGAGAAGHTVEAVSLMLRRTAFSGRSSRRSPAVNSPWRIILIFDKNDISFLFRQRS